ncbi:MAG: RNA polymerase sigma factor [Phycisphaerales bacterium]
MREYGAMVHAVARRIVGTVAEADDVAQETFLSAFRTWRSFRGDADPGTWLYRITVRAASRLLRRKSRRRERDFSTAETMPFADARLPNMPEDSESPAARRLRAEAREEVNEAISTLPTPFRLAVVLKDIAELPLEQISSILDLKVATVKTRVHRGRLMLRAALLADAQRVHVPPAIYERSMCMDLLRAKMEALDHGVPFPVQEELVCERCRNVFASLDLGFDACQHAAHDADLPTDVKKLVLAEIAREGIRPRKSRRR